VRAILSLDPGLCTGWAAWQEDSPESPDLREVCDPMELVDAVDSWLRDLRDGGYDRLVVAEEFRVNLQTAKKTFVPWSLELTGAVRWLCHRHGVPFAQQTPGEAKGFCDNERLRALGLWHRGGEGHANDAARHLALFLAKVRDPWVLGKLAETAS
jgi:hypothetical protein